MNYLRSPPIIENIMIAGKNMKTEASVDGEKWDPYLHQLTNRTMRRQLRTKRPANDIIVTNSMNLKMPSTREISPILP